MARQHAGTAVISEGHKEVVNIRTAGAASKCSAGNAIRIRTNSSQNYSYLAKQSKTTIRYTLNLLYRIYCITFILSHLLYHIILCTIYLGKCTIRIFMRRVYTVGSPFSVTVLF